MKETIYLSSLYDYYYKLLTEKQRQIFEDYYFNNLTLSEIAENYGISRNAVHKTLKEVENKLKDYESKLKLLERYDKIKEIVDELDENVKNKILDLL